MKITTAIIYNLLVLFVAIGLSVVFAGCDDDVDLGYDLEDCNFAMDIDQGEETNTPVGYAIYTDDYSGIPGCQGVYTEECSGSDCDQLFSTREDCEDSMNSCIEDMLEANCSAACNVLFNCYQEGEGEDGQTDGEHNGGISHYFFECIDACTDVDGQEVPYLCAESAECFAGATCSNLWEQECEWNSDCFYRSDY